MPALFWSNVNFGFSSLPDWKTYYCAEPIHPNSAQVVGTAPVVLNASAISVT